jgi:drug/metabolite transporter (DMT)-like permease
MVDHFLAVGVLVEVASAHIVHHPHLHLHLHLPPDLARLRLRLHRDLDRVDIPAIAVIECLAGALSFAASSVLQQRAAAEQPADLSMRIGLLVRLLRSGRWMLGNVLDVVGYVMQFLALRRAALALVEPLFVIGLVFSVVGAALAAGRRPTRAEWGYSLSVVAGVALFVAAARPGPGHPRASSTGWVALFAATAVITIGSVVLGNHYLRWRALILGASAGVVFGVTAAVTEHTGKLLDLGVVSVLSTWAPYVLAVLGILGLLLNQSAYQAGDLRHSLPVLTIAEPVVAIVIGQALFGEHINATALAVLGETAGLLIMSIGVLQLSRVVSAPAVGAAEGGPRRSVT